MVWTVIYSDKSVKEIVTNSNSYTEAHRVARSEAPSTPMAGRNPDVFAIIRGNHREVVRTF